MQLLLLRLWIKCALEVQCRELSSQIHRGLIQIRTAAFSHPELVPVLFASLGKLPCSQLHM